jgi:hypothetical protein
MMPTRNSLCLLLLLSLLLLAIAKAGQSTVPSSHSRTAREAAQVPAWSRQDLDFFLHGSMSTELIPETVLQAFIRTYPDLFPSRDLSHLGLLPDPAFGWPIGFSRREVPHLGGLSAVGVNCAACHVGEVKSASGAITVRVLGMTSHFDAEAFFGAVIVASFRTADSANMKKFLSAYLAVSDPKGGRKAQKLLERAWQAQEQQIVAALAADPFGAKNIAPGALHPIASRELRLNRQLLEGHADLASLTRAMLKLFHNMRAAVHVPDQPPDKAPPASGPGRNDAFGLLSAVLFGVPQPYAPVKYGLVWNLENRRWVHWDGNTQSPIGRNLLASLGLGAPLIGKHGELDFAAVQRHTRLSEYIRAPRYPFAIDRDAAKRGAAHYESRCASCHDGPEGDRRLYSVSETGTEPQRAELFTQIQADHFNTFLAELQTPGYQTSKEPGIRSTQKYWAASLAGVWARSPYLHNGSVRTMRQLLTPPAAREKSFHRGSRTYDAARMGYADDGPYVLDTGSPGNANVGHNFGTDLSDAQKRELIEYLKAL